MANRRNSVLASLEGIGFVKDIGSRLKIPTRAIVYGLGALVSILLVGACYIGFSLQTTMAAEIMEVQPSLAFEHLSTEFDNPPDVLADTLVQAIPESCVVYVTGAVQSPGLYTLVAGNRIGDAVQAAGGFCPEAAEATVNLAQPVADGMQIHIPQLDEVSQNSPGNVINSVIEATFSTASTAPTASSLVNINTADSATLQTLNGIGPATAQKIIDYRTANGPFSTKEELMRVSGIGAKKYAAIEAYITI